MYFPQLTPHTQRKTLRRHALGITMIELLLAMLLAVFVSLGVFGILASAEGRKRVSTGINNIEQAGNIAAFQIDQWVRSAGSGFSVQAATAYGCTLNAKAVSGQVLPMTAAAPAPFASVNPDGNRNFVLAPVIILPGGTTPAVSGQSSDVLVVMGGNAAMAGLSIALRASPTATSLSVDNSQAFSASDLVLLTDPNAPTQCILVQVSATFTDTTLTSLPLAGGFFSATINSQSITSLSADTIALPLGVPTTTSAPQFLLIGVGDNNTLFTYDLLQTTGSTQALQARASGVFEMHAIYGVDSDGDGLQDSWASPSSGTYAASKFAAGTSDLATLIKNIKSIRVAIAMQTNETISASATGPQSSLVFFPDLSTQGLSVTRTLSNTEQRSRYRIVDATIVLRNNQ